MFKKGQRVIKDGCIYTLQANEYAGHVAVLKRKLELIKTEGMELFEEKPDAKLDRYRKFVEYINHGQQKCFLGIEDCMDGCPGCTKITEYLEEGKHAI